MPGIVNDSIHGAEAADDPVYHKRATNTAVRQEEAKSQASLNHKDDQAEPTAIVHSSLIGIEGALDGSSRRCTQVWHTSKRARWDEEPCTVH